jgi:hypothetical protein
MNQSLPQTFTESSKLLQQNFHNFSQGQEVKTSIEGNSILHIYKNVENVIIKQGKFLYA